MDVRTYYRQHPEEILHRDEHVVITFSADREQPCLQFRDPHTMKVVFTVSYAVIDQAQRKSGRLPAYHDIEIMKKIKARKEDTL